MTNISSWEGLWRRLCVSLRAWGHDHWRGDLSLAESFWINCFFVNLGAGIVLRRMMLSQTGIVFWVVFSVAISAWQLVGLWRSAHKNSKKQPFWSLIVKGLCVMNVVFFVMLVLAGLGLLAGFGEGGINLPAQSHPSGFLET